MPIWLSGEIIQGVVHPSHIPLKIETQSANGRGISNLRKGGRFLSDGNHPRILLMHSVVKLFNEINCLEVFITAVAIWNPLPLFSGIVQVKHGRDRIHAISIYAKSVDPGNCTANQKASHFGPTIIVTKGAPFSMKALFGIGMLKQTGSIKPRKSKFIRREMAGNPVNNNPYILCLKSMDKDAEFFGEPYR